MVLDKKSANQKKFKNYTFIFLLLSLIFFFIVVAMTFPPANVIKIGSFVDIRNSLFLLIGFSSLFALVFIIYCNKKELSNLEIKLYLNSFCRQTYILGIIWGVLVVVQHLDNLNSNIIFYILGKNNSYFRWNMLNYLIFGYLNIFFIKLSHGNTKILKCIAVTGLIIGFMFYFYD